MIRLGDLVICLLAVCLNTNSNFKGGVNTKATSCIYKQQFCNHFNINAVTYQATTMWLIRHKPLALNVSVGL